VPAPLAGNTLRGMRPSNQVEVGFNGRQGTVTTVSLHIKTLEEALRASRVDMKVWEVDRYVINSWEVTIGKKNNDGAAPGTFTNYQVKVWLRRLAPTVMEMAIEGLLAKIAKQSKHVAGIQLPISEGRFMLEVSLFDAHFGLLAWRRETGDDYGLTPASESYALTMEDLLTKTKGCRPEKILLPFGNDYFHVNNPEGLTPTAHNMLDVDGRLAKVVEAGERAIFRAIDRCLQVAPVEVIWIPGNHDPQTSYFLCRTIKAQYHNNANVTVNIEPAPRKYVQFGCNLIGFTHGNEEKHGDLPTIMATEQREIWSQVRHCEWHLGHFHKKKETRYSAGDTYGGVQVKVIPSISGTDAWHFSKGYVKGNRMAEAFLFDFEDGLVATYSSHDLRFPLKKAAKS
jgi:hypothetical protein